MALVVKDRVQETTITVGTITLVLLGAVSGFQPFSVIGNGNTTYYAIVGGTEWEVGIGTYTLLGTTLSRDTILSSSNGGTAVNFSAGTKNVFVTYPADKSIYDDAAGNVIGLGTPASVTLTNATGLPLSTGVTGTLPIANGGTNNASLAVTAGGVVYTDGSKLVNVGAGTTGQALFSNGTSAPTWGSVGSLSWQAVQTTGFTAVSGNGYPCNTTTAAFTVTLPASPSAGNTISIIDYAGTSATNNITVNPNGNKLQGSTASGKISTNREGVNLVYVDATQGWLSYADVYSSGNPLPSTYTASYLIVAGGGSGGGSSAGAVAGGGGSGGYVTGTTTFVPGTVYTAVVGGGASAPAGVVSGTQGTNSTFTGLTSAVGGGGGAVFPSTPSATGGSGGSGGGGGGGAPGQGPGGAGTPGQGNNGGAGASGAPAYGGGGGGGSGAVGAAGTGPAGGAGGNGTANPITGSSVIYAGGGGGGVYNSGTGGLGGPGTPGVSGGNAVINVAGTAGIANTGGGGGAGSGASNSNAGGAGGSGVVILSVPTSSYSGTTTGSPTITTSGSDTIIKFTSGSGTYTA